jgi:hypothetical protein
LLGLDAGRIVSSVTMASLQELLGDTNRREQLIDGMASEDRGIKGARQKSDQLLGLFIEGLEEGAGA